MKKVLLVQPSLQPPGGSNGVAVWIVEALKRDYAVSVLSWTPVEVTAINRYYGTSLSESDFAIRSVHPIVRRLLGVVPWHLAFLKNQLLLSECRRIREEYDIIIAGNNEADVGREGIQYVHFPWVGQRRSALANAYHRLCMRLSRFSLERMRRNLTLVNSDWTGSRVRERHGIDTTTVYPMVPGAFPEVPWESRENGFVCVGKITPRKEIEKIIEILARVRAAGEDIHLHIVGSVGDMEYYRRIRALIGQNRSWVGLEENPSRGELERLLSVHRYGIHGMAEEPFGIAVAEMVRAGCVVFLPWGGGQAEIVGADERLLYETTEEAARKIINVLRDESLQRSLRAFLASRKELFSTEAFKGRIREVVRSFGNGTLVSHETGVRVEGERLMGSPPLVSVVISNYNYAGFVGEAIESALGQTYPHVEIIVVDDGSTDNSRQVIESYGERVVGVLKENGGMGSALNAGFAASKGDVIIFLDADDLLCRDTVARVVEAWRPGVAKVQYRLQVIDAGRTPQERYLPPKGFPMPSGDLRGEILGKGFHVRPPTSGNAFSRKVMERCLPMPETEWRQFAETYLGTWAPFCGEVISIPTALGLYRVHGRNDSVVRRQSLQRLAGLVEYRLQTYRLVEQVAGEFGLKCSDRLGREDPGYLKHRLASLVVNPAGHPIPGDKVWQVGLWGVEATVRCPNTSLVQRAAFLAWFIFVAFLPERVVRRLVRWGTDASARPAWLRALARYRSGRAS